ncbi:MAG: excalibur calcium-binding domain-containing protein [Sphingomonas sp.]|uniref:excalibur calcium-binding domain-containing protein n=1 Tax=Sphingomonas sp. TaxID=28214 RepID=UPI001B2F3800|nr:excalibur calcium-binding domain-containing protein [Sphingomonas sp.]MBO9623946.1 excalibur calcium-binding domain-containing protein [Sphingomonas sp.]
MTPEQREVVERSVYYRNCDAARAAGAAPIERGEPGYREEMDGDSDGTACEPYY